MTLLMLGGTGDARHIATRLHDLNVDVIASFAGATRAPTQVDVPVRVGGFGGRSGFVDYLAEAGITAVLDATHPFANRITDRTASVCAELGMRHAILDRAPWKPVAGDRWIDIDCEEDAATHITKGQTVFLGTGRQTVDRYANLMGCRVICRQIDPPDRPFPFPGGEFLVGRPPFPVADERALFQKLGVDWLVVKHAGGTQSETKLIAARELSIPVLMIKRPPLPDATLVHTVDEAVAWVMQ